MRIEKLDGLRGVFSLMVVFYHYPAYFDVYHITSNFLVDWSELFVDFFFVLSGFVIALNYTQKIKGRELLWAFLVKRVIRLTPLLVFTVLLYFILEFVSNTYFAQFMDTSMSYEEMAIRTLDSLALLNSTPLMGTTLGMNTPSWSISAEMIAYVVFGLAVLFTRGRPGGLFLLIAAVCIWFCIARRGYLFTGDFGFVRGLIGFLAGYLVYRLNDLSFSVDKNVEWALLPTLLLIFYGLDVYKSDPLVELYALSIIPLFFAGSMLVLLRTEGVVSNLMRHPVFSFLGKISYSIYLTHALFVFTVPKFFFTVLGFEQVALNLLAVMVITIGAAILFSTWTYRYIEMGSSRFLKKRIGLVAPQPVSKLA